MLTELNTIPDETEAQLTYEQEDDQEQAGIVLIPANSAPEETGQDLVLHQQHPRECLATEDWPNNPDQRLCRRILRNIY